MRKSSKLILILFLISFFLVGAVLVRMENMASAIEFPGVSGKNMYLDGEIFIPFRKDGRLSSIFAQTKDCILALGEYRGSVDFYLKYDITSWPSCATLEDNLYFELTFGDLDFKPDTKYGNIVTETLEMRLVADTPANWETASESALPAPSPNSPYIVINETNYTNFNGGIVETDKVTITYKIYFSDFSDPAGTMGSIIKNANTDREFAVYVILRSFFKKNVSVNFCNSPEYIHQNDMLFIGTGPDFIDIGLRVYDGQEIVPIAAEPDSPSSPFRIKKNGITYGVALVPITYSSAAKVRIQTSSGIMALRKYKPCP